MSFFVFGVSHKQCPVAIREKLYLREAQIEDFLKRALKKENSIQEFVVLSTCNRVEFYGYSEDDQRAQNEICDLIQEVLAVSHEEYESYVFFYKNKEAIRHLYRVSSGLDSLVVGENEILGQVRQAFRLANQNRSAHSFLYRLMEKALKIGKEVRSQTKINEGAVSIPSVAVELAEKIFGKLSGEKVMVLGTGDMSVMTLKNLRDSGADVLYVVSRQKEKGESVAREFGAEWLTFEDWQRFIPKVDILIASTAAPHAVVHEDQIQQVMQQRHYKPLFLIDIGVPRNVEPQVEMIDAVYLYNIDDLKGVSASNLRLRQKEIEAADDIIEDAVLSFQAWMEQLQARPTMERFERFLDSILTQEIDAWGKQVGLEESEKNKMRQRLRGRLLHGPLEKMKEASRNGGVARYVEALHSLFNLEDDQTSKNNKPLPYENTF